MSLPYTKKVLEHFMHPHNVGKLENPDAVATEGSPACGDMVKLYLKVDQKTKQIDDIRFESYGCASNIATGSIITDLAIGKTLEDAKKLDWKMAAEALGGLPPVKVHCAVLAVDALRTAIENYEHQHGLLKEKIPTSEKIIMKRLSRVINPLAGLDVVRTKLVKEVIIDKGIVTVFVELPSSHQFANNIRNEISERIEPLWDVQKVKIVFRGN
ncbi:iron-sulfur cluster assembly scaffold protein [bacterium]|nr:iron-sulfur cluster assembly scaffold protein [bacterium]RQV98309.1 MAG: iron-sulfur cluster assembly scaffold protein [bacterium]